MRIEGDGDGDLPHIGNCKIAEPMRTDARLRFDFTCLMSISEWVVSRANDSRSRVMSSCEVAIPRDAIAP